MSDLTIPMSAAHLATTMANRVQRERTRIAERLVPVQAVLNRGDSVEASNLLYALVEELRSGVPSTPPVVAAVGPIDPGEPEPMDVDELPPVRHMDDFEEGTALVQGAMFRRGVTGYNGATGNLRGGPGSLARD